MCGVCRDLAFNSQETRFPRSKVLKASAGDGCDGCEVLFDAVGTILHDDPFEHGMTNFDMTLPTVRKASGGSLLITCSELTIEIFGDYRKFSVQSNPGTEF